MAKRISRRPSDALLRGAWERPGGGTSASARPGGRGAGSHCRPCASSLRQGSSGRPGSGRLSGVASGRLGG